MAQVPDIPPHTRDYILFCVEHDLSPDRARIAAETGLGCEYVLSVICRVISERHGFACGPPWKEDARVQSLHQRKPPKQRANLKPCTCNHEPHTSPCPVYHREYHRKYRAKVS